MSDKISERRQSERMPTEIQGKVDGEKCFISNLSDGGLLLLSTFKGSVGQEVTIQFTFNDRFFEKKGIIRETNTVSKLRTPMYKNNFMYAVSVAFIGVVTESDFFSLKD